MYTFNHLTNVGLQEVKFKTTIEISSEAENKNEAMEIVGEYLAGYLSSGVDMMCSTRSVSSHKKGIISVIVISLLLSISILSIGHIKPAKNFIGTIPVFNAVQPPLKTSSEANKGDFKKKWEAKHTKEALTHIKK